MGSYHNDQPITGMEDLPDQLNRESFAEHLAEILIIHPDNDCITVSLEGEWGYGKTSVINLVKKALRKLPKKPITIEYNPWLSGKAEAMVQDFLVQFSSQLKIPNKPKEGLKAAKALLAYSELFNAMKFIPGVEPWASTIQSVIESTGKAAREVSELKQLDLLGRKNKVKKIISSLNKPIIVIIDDIDRLTPDEAFQVVRLVKAVADFPGTSFLLSFDPIYLASALKKHGIEKSEQYIDKVVQLRIQLPLIAHSDLQKLADSELKNLSDKELTDHFEQDQDRLSYIYHTHIKYLIRTPRELKRLFNHLRFVLAQTEGKVCFTDLYCLSVLATKSHEIYQSLKDSPEYYLGRKFDESFDMNKREDVTKNHKHRREELIDGINKKDAHHITGLLNELFPLTDDQEYNLYSSDYDQCGRVASEKRLYIALHYQTPSGFASDTDTISFIEGKIDRIKYLEKAISDDFVERFFELLQQNLEKVKTKNISDILKSLYIVFLNSDYLKQFDERNLGFFRFEPFRNIVWLTTGLLKKFEEKDEILFDLASDPRFLPVTADITRRLMVQAGIIETDDPKLHKEKWLSQDKYENLIETWANVAINEFKTENLIHSIHASHIFFVLYRAAPNETKKLFKIWLQEESGIQKIANLIGRSGTDSTNGPYAEITEKSLNELLDFNKLKNLASIELSTNKNIPSNLKAIYLSITTGEKYYLKDATKEEKF